MGLSLGNTVEELLIRVAASGIVPARLVQREIPDPAALPARSGTLAIELVSHCWQYAHLLAYQLSSLVNYPPTRCTVTMTVCHSPEDPRTVSLLEFFGALHVPGVRWNWLPMERHQLFRRSIGRNLRARDTAADWIWFTDCDIIFHQLCLDSLSERLQGRNERLFYPRSERVTAMLPQGDPLLDGQDRLLQVVDIDTSAFAVLGCPRATGAYQIVHGDLARACGYCAPLPVFQRPAERWAKTYEDRAFRWLMRTQGEPLDIPGVYRIRHVQKGRYGSRPGEALVRSNIRRFKAWLKSRW